MSMFLALNAGSSSIKFSIFAPAADEPEELATGQVENLGPAARLKTSAETVEIGAADHKVALNAILKYCGKVVNNRTVSVVGHRIAHGGVDFTGPAVLTEAVLAKLAALEPLAPLHQPHNLTAVRAAQAAFPNAAQIGCFDTAFHRGHPWVSDAFGLPRRFYDEGVRRYGFHGLSYEYISGEIARREPELAAGRVIIAHLGNGASMCAVRAGKSVASTMGFSALDGLAMGTRCGQLDPGVLLYLMDRGMSASEITTLLYKESGLKGLSGMTNDMRVLEASNDPRAAEAIDYYVFRIRRELGALTAVLGGLDALVFTGGIGENSPFIRERVCENMAWIGIELDDDANAENAMEISTPLSRARVLRLPTNEELVIARAAAKAPHASPAMEDA